MRYPGIVLITNIPLNGKSDTEINPAFDVTEQKILRQMN
jgi:hypothetical protein